MSGNIKRIALIGPESTGKTTLCQQLAEHFNTVWVPEYAREYIEKLNRPYTLEDIEYCAKMQIEQEDTLIKSANHFLFSDTELILAKVWCEDVFKITPGWMEEGITKRKYDLYLLSYHDLDFEEDSVRENPHRRNYFFDWYKRELEKRNFDFVILKGIESARFKNALEIIEERFPSGGS